MDSHLQSPSVPLPPALLLQCSPTWDKFLIFALFVNIPPLFLHYFGFGLSYSYSLLFCNCGAWSAFALLLLTFNLHPPKTVPTAVLQILLTLLTGALVGALLFAKLHGWPPGEVLSTHRDVLMRMLVLNIFFGSMAVFFFKSRESISQARRMILEERIASLNMRNLAIEAELKLLQAQIEPHFLFNTLSNVLSLIESDPPKAKAMLETFSEFLRGCIHLPSKRDILLSQELELARNYLEIHRLRMGERLHYSIEIPDPLLQCRIPPLIIQPLLENSIKHGLEPKLEGGSVSIHAERQGQSLRIRVVDTGRGITESSEGNGIGLDNVRNRIRMISKEEGRLILEENHPSGVTATIEVPHEIAQSHYCR